MKLSAFDYTLPAGRIAQHPLPERDASRLLVLRRPGNRSGGPLDRQWLQGQPASSGPGTLIEHAIFRDLDRYLEAGDLLVLNDTRVFPARLVGSKQSGGRIEILLVEREEGRSSGTLRNESRAGGREARRGAHSAEIPAAEREQKPIDEREETWLCLAGFSRPPASGSHLDVCDGLEVCYLGRGPGEMHRVSLRAPAGESVRQALARSGRVPLPPYIERNGDSRAAAEDGSRYQTIYAETDGAIAAPTAGLHFTAALLDRLVRKGVRTARVTLHVGPATFLPVRTDDIRDHPMGAERYEVLRATAEAVAETRARNRRVVAVGTTAVRALESASDGQRGLLAARGRTDLFIYPGYRFRVVDSLVTNFHLPRSSLLMLVCAFAGRAPVLAAYQEAIARDYRFYSYGDAMLIL